MYIDNNSNTKTVAISFIAALAISSLSANDIIDNNVSNHLVALESIVVQDNGISNANSFVSKQDIMEPNNAQSFTQKSIKTFSGQTNINPLKTIQMSPSINYTASDDIGMDSSSMRIRGRASTGPVSVVNVEDLPIMGSPGGGKTMFDLENVSQIDLYKGYIPVDKGLGFSNLIGKANLSLARPTGEFGANLSQSFGSNDFRRSFIRVDTPKVGDVSVFGSFADTLSDKNKGYGDIKATSGMIGLVYTPRSDLKAELFVAHNNEDFHNYYGLTYAESKDLGTNYKKDYTNNAGSSSYFNYNKANYSDTAVIANIEYKPSGDSVVSFKPYYKNDVGTSYSASGTTLTKWNFDHDQFGAVLKYEKAFSPEFITTVGLWIHKQLPPGPPSNQNKYTIGSNGSLTYAGYSQLNDVGYHEFKSPFIEAKGTIDKFVYSAGLRYLDMKVGSFSSHTSNSSASTSQDYDTALATTAVNTWATASAQSFREWLPSLYLGYNAAKNLTAYIDYTRTYGLDLNLPSSYAGKYTAFKAQNVTLQYLIDKRKLELSDNIDIGAKYSMGDININPNLYAAFVKNKQANIYDPAYNVTYPYNAANALAYGAELSADGALTDNLDFLLGLSYNKFNYTQDLQTSSTAVKSTKGNQVPDAPKFMAKAALSYKLLDVTLTPSVSYLSKRYGDVLNQEVVDSYTVVNFDASYEKKGLLGAKSALFTLSVSNLFNEKYISVISAGDDAANLSTKYYTGAPIGIYANANFKF